MFSAEQQMSCVFIWVWNSNTSELCITEQIMQNRAQNCGVCSPTGLCCFVLEQQCDWTCLLHKLNYLQYFKMFPGKPQSRFCLNSPREVWHVWACICSIHAEPEKPLTFPVSQLESVSIAPSRKRDFAQSGWSNKV